MANRGLRVIKIYAEPALNRQDGIKFPALPSLIHSERCLHTPVLALFIHKSLQ